MPHPSLLSRIRQTVGRAFRETGQALDRAGVWGAQHATTARVFGDDPYKYDDHLSRHRNKMPLLWRGAPIVDENVAYIAPCSTLIGRVEIGPGSSVWYGAVLRADAANCGVDKTGTEEERKWRAMTRKERSYLDEDRRGGPGGGGIYVGSHTNVQDGAILTANDDHAVLGDYVTVGHGAQIHSATVGDYALIGMNSIIRSGATVESEAFVAAGAVVGEGETVKSGELWAGNPARKLRDLTEEQRGKLRYQAEQYVMVAEGQSGVMALGGSRGDLLKIEADIIGAQPTKDEEAGSADEKEEIIKAKEGGIDPITAPRGNAEGTSLEGEKEPAKAAA
mmetsp:Transcript_3798/g.8086  ORF Transcript_3798/g.8086 Transcript_3798/m.8086 type:complete len:335 (-) Transcript_3798:88-1092(-)